MDSATLPWVTPPGLLYRIARRPDPWRPPDWAAVEDDLTFGNRFDDSEGLFRVLYASSTPLGCYLETLARYRRPPGDALATALRDIEFAEDEPISAGTVPASWLKPRVLGVALARRSRFAHVYSSEWLGFLRREFEPGYLFHRFAPETSADFDLALLMSQRRALTQQIATLAYRLGYQGIYYQSRHGAEIENWALFEPYKIKRVSRRDLDARDPDLMEALARLNLRLNPLL